MVISNRFGVFSSLDGHAVLQDNFKREIFKAIEKCIEERPRSWNRVDTKEALESIDGSSIAMLTWYSM